MKLFVLAVCKRSANWTLCCLREWKIADLVDVSFSVHVSGNVWVSLHVSIALNWYFVCLFVVLMVIYSTFLFVCCIYGYVQHHKLLFFRVWGYLRVTIIDSLLPLLAADVKHFILGQPDGFPQGPHQRRDGGAARPVPFLRGLLFRAGQESVRQRGRSALLDQSHGRVLLHQQGGLASQGEGTSPFSGFFSIDKEVLPLKVWGCRPF